MKRFIRAGLLGLGFCAAASAQTNGIFADFATSHGAFTVWLDHTSAPRAVASFVGLATGAGSWLDPQGNVWTNRPFYNGSLFHRVVKDTNGFGIAIQGGGLPAFHLGEIGVLTEYRRHGMGDLVLRLLLFKALSFGRLELAVLGNEAGIIGAAMLGRLMREGETL